MRPTLAILFVFAAGLYAQDITVAARSPRDLVEFVQNHHDFDWEPLWNFSAVSEYGPFLPHCSQTFSGVSACTADLLPVPDSEQIIVVLEHRESSFHVFLRYQKTAAGDWRITGSYTPVVRYFRPEYRLYQLGEKPFLILSEQGISGAGVSSELEDWFDLSRELFLPVLTFTRHGRYSPWPSGIGREVHSTVVSVEAQPVEQITLNLDAAFEFTAKDGATLPLFHRTDRMVLTRNAAGDFTAHGPDAFYDIQDDPEPGPAAFLRFAWQSLAEIAANPADKRFPWLTAYLKTCPDIPESRRLKAALYNSPIRRK